MDMLKVWEKYLEDKKGIRERQDKLRKEENIIEEIFEKERDNALDNDTRVKTIKDISAETGITNVNEFREKIQKMWQTATHGMGRYTPVGEVELSGTVIIISQRGIGYRQRWHSKGTFHDMPLECIADVIAHKEKIREHIRPSYRETFDKLMTELESIGIDLHTIEEKSFSDIKVPLVGIDKITVKDWTGGSYNEREEAIEEDTYYSPFGVNNHRIMGKDSDGRSASVVNYNYNNDLIRVFPIIDNILESCKELRKEYKKAGKDWVKVISVLKGFTIVSDIADAL